MNYMNGRWCVLSDVFSLVWMEGGGAARVVFMSWFASLEKGGKG